MFLRTTPTPAPEDERAGGGRRPAEVDSRRPGHYIYRTT
jgi:hypothetical protein